MTLALNRLNRNCKTEELISADLNFLRSRIKFKAHAWWMGLRTDGRSSLRNAASGCRAA